MKLSKIREKRFQSKTLKPDVLTGSKNRQKIVIKKAFSPALNVEAKRPISFNCKLGVLMSP